jgi:hypothetical protein
MGFNRMGFIQQSQVYRIHKLLTTVVAINMKNHQLNAAPHEIITK